MKLVNIVGLTFSVIGSILVGLIAQEGIPKQGEMIKAPKFKLTKAGWILVILGFILSLIVAIADIFA